MPEAQQLNKLSSMSSQATVQTQPPCHNAALEPLLVRTLGLSPQAGVPLSSTPLPCLRSGGFLFLPSLTLGPSQEMGSTEIDTAMNPIKEKSKQNSTATCAGPQNTTYPLTTVSRLQPNQNMHASQGQSLKDKLSLRTAICFLFCSAGSAGAA